MAEQQPPDTWEEVRKIHREHWFFYQISFGGFLVFVVVLIGAAVFGADRDYVQELFMQALGIIITILVLDRLAQRREEQREEKALKERLVMEVHSRSNETAKRAVDELRHRQWLTGEDSLLQEVDLGRANLRESDLGLANLQGSDLWNATFQDAKMWGCNLKNTKMLSANLQGAYLKLANLQRADLKLANLCGANLLDADLQEADLESAQFNKKTRLPDGAYWKPEVDLTRFTDPNHPQFWRSDDKRSSAYRDKSSDQPTTKNE